MTLPVTLSSDFGRYYPAAMRGVLASRGIATIHDVTHELPPHDIQESAFWLRTLLPHFPPSVHCVVVDPGVGGARGVSIIRAGGHALVGPDNGVLWPVATELALGGDIECYSFNHVEPASATFHGRDVFSPVAAAVAHLGVDRLDSLPTVSVEDTPMTLTLPTPAYGETWIETEIIATDRFGNAITSAEQSLLPMDDIPQATVDGTSVAVCARYGAVSIGDPLVTVGSHGHIELAANQRAGTEAFGVSVGDRVRIAWSTTPR